MSRIECLFAVSQPSKYLTNPTTEHLQQGIRVVEYLLSYPYEIGPPPVVLLPNASMTVDFMAQSYRLEDLGAPWVVGELKKPGIIRKNEWLNPEEATAATIRFAKEARGKVHHCVLHHPSR
jgi:hypothetical protein